MVREEILGYQEETAPCGVQRVSRDTQAVLVIKAQMELRVEQANVERMVSLGGRDHPDRQGFPLLNKENQDQWVPLDSPDCGVLLEEMEPKERKVIKLYLEFGDCTVQSGLSGPKETLDAEGHGVR